MCWSRLWPSRCPRQRQPSSGCLELIHRHPVALDSTSRPPLRVAVQDFTGTSFLSGEQFGGPLPSALLPRDRLHDQAILIGVEVESKVPLPVGIDVSAQLARPARRWPRMHRKRCRRPRAASHPLLSRTMSRIRIVGWISQPLDNLTPD